MLAAKNNKITVADFVLTPPSWLALRPLGTVPPPLPRAPLKTTPASIESGGNNNKRLILCIVWPSLEESMMASNLKIFTSTPFE
jgi:hypothetical protein